MKPFHKKLLLMTVMGLSIGLGFAIFFQIFSFISFVLHNKTHEELRKILYLPGKEYSYQAYYMSGGATTSNYIQLRRVYKSGKYDIIKTFQHQKFVRELKMDTEKGIVIVLGGGISKFSAPPDTFYLQLFSEEKKIVKPQTIF